MRVPGPGIYTMPLEQYVQDPAPEPSINSGTALTMLTQSPKHVYQAHPRLGNGGKDDSSRADLGTVAHNMLLEDDRTRIVQIDADDWRTKAAKEKRDEARADGKTPILTKDYDKVCRMVEVVDHVLFGSPLCTDWMEATPEQSLIWKECGTWFRSRPDKLTPDGKIYFDYKTSASAHPSAFVRTAINNGYDLQAAIGKRGVEALKGVTPTVVFVVQEITEPYAVSLVSLSPQFMTIANERLELARYKWDACLKSKEWPGYPDSIMYVDPPGYYGMDQLDMIPEGA